VSTTEYTMQHRAVQIAVITRAAGYRSDKQLCVIVDRKQDSLPCKRVPGESSNGENLQSPIMLSS